jgi:hypothetical protein
MSLKTLFFCFKTISSPSKMSSAVAASTEMDLKRLKMSLDEVISEEMKVWTRSAPADLYYERDVENPRMVRT